MLTLDQLIAVIKFRNSLAYRPGDALGEDNGFNLRREQRPEDYSISRPKKSVRNKRLSVPTPVEIIDDYTGDPLLVPRGTESSYKSTPTKKNLL